MVSSGAADGVRVAASVLELACDDAPAWFFAALAAGDGDASSLLGAGRGLSREAALASCLGESVERAVAERSPDGRRVLAIPPGGATGRIEPNAILQFSAAQLRDGPHPGEHLTKAEWSNARALVERCERWTLARSRTEASVWAVPAALAWLPATALPGSSNGLAAGRTRDAAERAAVLELVERDAVAIWWYGRCRRPPVALGTLVEAGGEALALWLGLRERRTDLLDLTHDIGLPVVIAVSSGQGGRDLAYGAAAGVTLARAALSACLEMLQAEVSLRLAARAERLTGSAEGTAGRFLLWSRQHDLLDFPHLVPAPDMRPEPVDDGAADPVAVVDRRGPHRVLFVDLDGPDDPLCVVRAIVPGLRTWRPRFAPGRLFDVAPRLGWCDRPFDPDRVGEHDVILI